MRCEEVIEVLLVAFLEQNDSLLQYALCARERWDFEQIRIALVLSALKGVGVGTWTPSSLSNETSQTIYEEAKDMWRYSTPVEDFKIRSCFLHFQEITEFP